MNFLIVEDNPADANFLERLLRLLRPEAVCRTVQLGGRAAMRAYWSFKPDVAFVDYMLGAKDGDGLALIRDLRRAGAEEGLMLLTGQGDEDVAASALRAGASDYLLKEALTPELVEKSLRHLEERRRGERALKKAVLERERAERKNRAKSLSLSYLSHELRTPMHAILSFVEICQDCMNKAREQPEFMQASKILENPHVRRRFENMPHYLERIQESGRRLTEMLDNILDLAKLEAGQIELDLRQATLLELVEMEAVDLAPLFSEKRLNLVIEPPAHPTGLVCDPGKIMQVIRNLLGNAIKFSPEGEVISVSFSVELLPGGEEGVAIFVRDRGRGVPEEELDLVFQHFAQSSLNRGSEGGTGLGLAISHEIIVNLHRGLIKVENHPGGGAVFWAAIPRDPLNEGEGTTASLAALEMQQGSMGYGTGVSPDSVGR